MRGGGSVRYVKVEMRFTRNEPYLVRNLDNFKKYFSPRTLIITPPREPIYGKNAGAGVFNNENEWLFASFK